MGMKILTEMCLSVKDERRTRGHLFSRTTVNDWNRLSTDCVGASSVYIYTSKN